MRGALLLLTTFVLLAGCAVPQLTPASTVGDAPQAAAGLVLHKGNLTLPADPAWAALKVRVAPTGFRGSEPSMGVLKDGTVVTVGAHPQVPDRDVLVRSKDGGKTWDFATGPLSGPASLDPWVHVDERTNRVWNAPLYVACDWAAYSDDGGDSWQANPLAGCGLPGHDHQKITTGPPAKGVTTSGYPDVVYYSYNSFRKEGTWISTSLDGGKTFSTGSAAHANDACHAGIAGPVAVAPDGTAYSAKPICKGLDVAVSKDSGQTWKVTGHVLDAGGYGSLAETVDVDTDTEGHAYAVWNGEDGGLYLTTSADGGATWSPAKRVSPPGVNVTTFSNLAAGAPGHVAIGYLGTRADATSWTLRTGEGAPDDAVWHAFLTFSDDALDAEPTFATQQVTPDDDPVQIGCIWLSGGSNACRNLGDFLDVQEREGRAYFVYTDGCPKCTSAATSHQSNIVVALVDSGPSLLGGALAPLGDAPAKPTSADPTATVKLPTLG